MVLNRRRCLGLVTVALAAAMMAGPTIPALAQTNKADQEKLVAQAEKKNPEEKGKPEEQGTTKEESAPSTGSILLGVVVGALLTGGGLLARARASSVGWYFARLNSLRDFPGVGTSSIRCSSR